MDQTIGEVAKRSGLTERTLRYYEELGLLEPRRDAGGHRRYDAEHLNRLYRIRLLREFGSPLRDIDPDSADLLAITAQHLADVDRQITELSRQRERVRAVEARLMSGGSPTDQELIGVLRGLPDPDAQVTRRITLLVHGEVYAGDGVIWMHREAPEFGLASPASLGAATHCMAVHVDDLDAHFARVTAAGGQITQEPTVMAYGVREYDARDAEGVLWSFMESLDDHDSAP